MKNYCVYVDITMSKGIFVDAENDEEAMKKASEMVEKDPYYYGRNADCYVSHEVIDVIEEEG